MEERNVPTKIHNSVDVLNLKRIIKYSIEKSSYPVGYRSLPMGEPITMRFWPGTAFDRVGFVRQASVLPRVLVGGREFFSQEPPPIPRYIISFVEVSIVVRARRRCTFRFERVFVVNRVDYTTLFVFFFLSVHLFENKDRFVRTENRLTLSMGMVYFIGREFSRYVL